jgi:hypothetical protein
MTTCPEGQLSNFAWIAAESSLPLGDSVAQLVVRVGTPALDVIPGFHAKFLSGGMIDPVVKLAPRVTLLLSVNV